MRGVNTAIVQRTQGLFEVQSLREKMGQASKNENAAITVQKQRYGSLFRYDEFFVTSSVWKALVMSFSFALAMLLLRFLPPVSQLVNPSSTLFHCVWRSAGLLKCICRNLAKVLLTS